MEVGGMRLSVTLLLWCPKRCRQNLLARATWAMLLLTLGVVDLRRTSLWEGTALTGRKKGVEATWGKVPRMEVGGSTKSRVHRSDPYLPLDCIGVAKLGKILQK